MLVATVIPLSKSAHRESLSYFSTKPLKVGDIVEVDLRKKRIDALVTHVEEVEDIKAQLKDASFALRKVVKVKGESFFSKELRSMAITCANYFLTTPGAILERLASDMMMEHYETLTKKKPTLVHDEKMVHQKLIFQAPLEERLSYYRSFIRESFAKKKSILLILPTHNDIERFFEYLKKGIEPYICVLHSGLRKNAYVRALDQITSDEHPLLIIGTAQSLALPRADIGMIIIEREASNAYRTIGAPLIDLRTCAEVYASHAGIPILHADTLLRSETAHRRTQEDVEELTPLTYRIAGAERVVSIKHSGKSEGKKFEPLTVELRELMKKSLSRGGHAILFVLRKGYSPLTACNDCGETLECINCSTPLVFYKDNETRNYQCHTCGTKESASLVCPHCGGWNLTGLGIGSEQVAQCAAEYFPDADIVLMDRDNIKSDTEAKKAMERFCNSTKGILVMTELGLHYMKDTVDMVGIVSLESLFSIPSFRAEERIAQLVVQFLELSKNTVAIQTRDESRRLLVALTQGTLLPMYRTELVERKEYGYPPYTTLIKLTAAGPEDRTREELEHIARMLAPWHPEVYSAFVRKMAGNYRYHLLLKIPRKDWSLPELEVGAQVDKDLHSRLGTLPMSIKKQVDPEDIL